jgi:hypothetical protein
LHGGGVVAEAGGHLVVVAQVRPGPGGQPTVQVIQAGAGADGGEHTGQPVPRGRVVVRRGSCHDRQAGFAGQLAQRGVAFLGQRLAGVGQLDGDVVAAEPLDQLGEGGPGRVEREGAEPARLERGPHRSLAAAGEHQPPPGALAGELVPVIDRPALRLTAQMRAADHPAQRRVPAWVAGQHQQMPPGRIRHTRAGRDRPPGLGLRQLDIDAQLRADDGGQPRLPRGGREPHHPGQPVVIGDRQPGQPEPHGFLDQLLRSAGPIQEGERRMGVQLRVPGAMVLV